MSLAANIAQAAPGAAIAVKSATGMWTATGVWTVLGLLSTIVVAYIKQWGPWKKLAHEREANLLHERAVEMDKMISRMEHLEATIVQERARHEAERALDRHRLNNMDQCLNYLFLIFEKMPEKVPDAIAAVKDMRARQIEAEAVEKAAIHAAAMNATAEKLEGKA